MIIFSGLLVKIVDKIGAIFVYWSKSLTPSDIKRGEHSSIQGLLIYARCRCAYGSGVKMVVLRESISA